MSYKKAIIIGNGCSIFNHENGKKIDDFDYVVRMGHSPRIKGYEKYVGTKTDMYRMKWFNMFNEMDAHSTGNISDTCRTEFDFNFRDILCICQDPDEYSEVSPTMQLYYNISLNRSFLLPIGNRFIHDFCITDFNLKEINWYFFNACDMETLMKKMNLLAYNTQNKSIQEKWIEPSGGLCTIWYFLKYRPEYTLYITGFDGFKTNHYWSPEIHNNFSSHSSIHERLFISKLLKEQRIYEL